MSMAAFATNSTCVLFFQFLIYSSLSWKVLRCFSSVAVLRSNFCTTVTCDSELAVSWRLNDGLEVQQELHCWFMASMILATPSSFIIALQNFTILIKTGSMLHGTKTTIELLPRFWRGFVSWKTIEIIESGERFASRSIRTASWRLIFSVRGEARLMRVLTAVVNRTTNPCADSVVNCSNMYIFVSKSTLRLTVSDAIFFAKMSTTLAINVWLLSSFG